MRAELYGVVDKVVESLLDPAKVSVNKKFAGCEGELENDMFFAAAAFESRKYLFYLVVDIEIRNV